MQQLRPSSGKPFFESPTPLDPALFLFLFAIMRKLQQTKDRACQAAGTQVTALERGLRSGFDLRHSAEASPKCQGGKMNREGGWSHAHGSGSPAAAPAGPPRLHGAPFSLELGGTSWCHPHRWTKQLPPHPLRSKAALLLISSKTQKFYLWAVFCFTLNKCLRRSIFPPSDDQCCIRQQVRPSSFPSKTLFFTALYRVEPGWRSLVLLLSSGLATLSGSW